MRRYWFEGSIQLQESISIDGDLFHHLHAVCRHEVGDKFELIANDSQAFFVEVSEVKKRSMTVKALESRRIPQLPKPHVHLCLSLPKFDRFETIVEKSVELGIKSIKPFTSEFSFISDVKKLSPERVQRWQKIIKGASQQSGRGDLMLIEPLVSMSEILASINRPTLVESLFLYEGVCKRTLKEKLREKKPMSEAEYWVFIGSEGGFSAAEVAQFEARGIEPVSLGDQVLRVETACLALSSILKYELHL